MLKLKFLTVFPARRAGARGSLVTLLRKEVSLMTLPLGDQPSIDKDVAFRARPSTL